MTHVPDEETSQTEEMNSENHEVPHAEAEVSIPVKPKPHKFTPPIHGNRFGGTQNFRGNNQRPGRAAQRGR